MSYTGGTTGDVPEAPELRMAVHPWDADCQN